MQRFTDHGPFWQWECKVCREMSDCYDSPSDRDISKSKHKCSITLRVPPWTTSGLDQEVTDEINRIFDEADRQIMSLIEKELEDD